MTYQVYILEATSRHRCGYHPTYIGATVDVERRLRQHNGELAGGARRTTAIYKGTSPAWRTACVVTGFRTWSETLKFEFALRRVGRQQVHRWDMEGRRRALELVLAMNRWSCTSPPASEIPLVVKWTS